MASVVLGHEVEIINIRRLDRCHERFFARVCDRTGGEPGILVGVVRLFPVQIIAGDLRSHGFDPVYDRRI